MTGSLKKTSPLSPPILWMRRTNRVGCNFFCDIEPPETGASRAEWAYRCRVPSNETHDMNKYELVAR